MRSSETQLVTALTVLLGPPADAELGEDLRTPDRRNYGAAVSRRLDCSGSGGSLD
jgi:hypothetical protein